MRAAFNAIINPTVDLRILMIVYTLNALRAYPAASLLRYHPSADVLASASGTLTPTTNTKCAQVLYGAFFEQNYTSMGANTCQRLLIPLYTECKALSTTVETILQKVQSSFLY